MKTININLVGDLGKISKLQLKEAKKGTSFDTRSQIFAYILIIGVLIVFTASLGGWLLVRTMTSHLDRKLIKLNENLNILKEQETQLSNFRQNLKKEKEITEFKIIVQKQLNSSFFPWSSVLKEISVKIPKDMIILKIEKTGNTGQVRETADSLALSISGIIPPNEKQQPLITLSLFIFNLNENKNSLLSNAKISKLSFNDKTKAYEFEVSVATSYKVPAL